ncbi:MAG: hypothetical protein HY541_02115 [Deltaproteobacteria bacterium]|nr:hypothetical protein [Deltaproteobacteria bacterium]
MSNDLSPLNNIAWSGMVSLSSEIAKPEGADEFRTCVMQAIWDGIDQDLSPRAVAEQIYPEFQQNPDLAEQLYPDAARDFPSLQKWIGDKMTEIGDNL